MTRELDEDEMEQVEQELADMFVHECWELAEELGFESPLTPEQEAELNAEFDRRHKPRLIAIALEDALYDERKAAQATMKDDPPV